MRSRWLNIFVLLSLLLGMLPLTVQAAPAAEPAAATEPAAADAQDAQKTVALRLSPEAYAAVSDLATLRVLDYGSFVWVVAPESTLSALDARGVQYTSADTTIGIYDYKFDPLMGEPEVPTTLRAPEGNAPGFHLVQFLGPVSDAWLAEMRATSLKPLQYYANNAYLVWGTPQVVDSLKSRPYTRWTGALHPAYKLSPSLAQYEGKIENVAVTFYNDGNVAQTVDALKQLGEYHQHYATRPMERSRRPF